MDFRSSLILASVKWVSLDPSAEPHQPSGLSSGPLMPAIVHAHGQAFTEHFLSPGAVWALGELE